MEITKELVEKSFPSFVVHYASLTKSKLFMLVREALHVQLVVLMDEGMVEYEIWKEGSLMEKDKVDKIVMIDAIKLKIKEYDSE